MMIYKEYKPSSYFSKHIESFWEIITDSSDKKITNIIMPPEGIFDILFINKAIFLKYCNDKSNNWNRINKGSFFIGLLTQGILFGVERNTRLFGIRLKPFSLSRVVNKPLFIYNNRIIRLQEIFNSLNNEIINSIINNESIISKIEKAELIIAGIIDKSYEIDQVIRGLLNNIMENKGDIKISKICEKFDVNKVSLRNNFLVKIGLSPKEISKIWRLNNFLKLRKESPTENLTALGYDAGYYDQSHLIKDFKSCFNISPHKFLNREYSYSLRFSQERIVRRFTNYYSPF